MDFNDKNTVRWLQELLLKAGLSYTDPKYLTELISRLSKANKQKLDSQLADIIMQIIEVEKTIHSAK